MFLGPFWPQELLPAAFYASYSLSSFSASILVHGSSDNSKTQIEERLMKKILH